MEFASVPGAQVVLLMATSAPMTKEQALAVYDVPAVPASTPLT